MTPICRLLVNLSAPDTVPALRVIGLVMGRLSMPCQAVSLSLGDRDTAPVRGTIQRCFPEGRSMGGWIGPSMQSASRRRAGRSGARI